MANPDEESSSSRQGRVVAVTSVLVSLAALGVAITSYNSQDDLGERQVRIAERQQELEQRLGLPRVSWFRRTYSAGKRADELVVENREQLAITSATFNIHSRNDSDSPIIKRIEMPIIAACKRAWASVPRGELENSVISLTFQDSTGHYWRYFHQTLTRLTRAPDYSHLEDQGTLDVDIFEASKAIC